MLSKFQGPFSGKNFLVRCDLDVINDKAEISEYYRLKSCLPTINFLLEKGGFVTIAGHFKSFFQISSDHDFSHQKLQDFFSENLVKSNFEVLPNLRNDPREITNNQQMAWELATNQDYYVNESFATSHREHTSICEITKYLPSFLGLHFEKEMQNLSFISQNPKRPLTVIIGGAKLESKLPTIEHFLQSSDYILVGGKLSSSPDLPTNPKIIRAVDTNQGLDIGEKSVLEFSKVISQSQTIFWSGPLGKVEEKPFDESSLKISEAIIKSHAFSVVGGGDTISFLEKNNLLDSFSFVSVGGSALLEYLSTGTLVGIEYYEKYGQKNT